MDKKNVLENKDLNIMNLRYLVQWHHSKTCLYKCCKYQLSCMIDLETEINLYVCIRLNLYDKLVLLNST